MQCENELFLQVFMQSSGKYTYNKDKKKSNCKLTFCLNDER